MNDLESEIDVSRRFFEAIKAGNNSEIANVFRNPNFYPWTFLEDDEYTGKNLFAK